MRTSRAEFALSRSASESLENALFIVHYGG